MLKFFVNKIKFLFIVFIYDKYFIMYIMFMYEGCFGGLRRLNGCYFYMCYLVYVICFVKEMLLCKIIKIIKYMLI